MLRVGKIVKVVKIASQAIATKILFESKFWMRRFSSDETDLKSKDLEKRQGYEVLKKKRFKKKTIEIWSEERLALTKENPLKYKKEILKEKRIILWGEFNSVERVQKEKLLERLEKKESTELWKEVEKVYNCSFK